MPLGLFRSRNFSVVNLSTLVIYGALYVSLTFQNLFLQGTLGYTPLASGMIGIPSSLLLTLPLDACRAAGRRYGARPFMVAGPLLMGAALFWISRIPATSAPGRQRRIRPASLVPPVDFLVDVLPTTLLFGIGIVAPGRAPDDRPDGVGAGRPGRAWIGDQQRHLAGRRTARERRAVHRDHRHLHAVARRRRHPATTGARRRSPTIQPLAPAPPGTPPDLAAAAQAASTEAFQLAMRVAGGLLLVGALVNLVGLERARAGVGG